MSNLDPSELFREYRHWVECIGKNIQRSPSQTIRAITG